MVQSPPHLLTADEFIARYGDDTRYELIDGELIELEPTGHMSKLLPSLGAS